MLNPGSAALAGKPRGKGSVQAEIERAQRFTIPMTLRYRPAGQQDWKQGTVENISRSGVLFRAQEPVEVQTAVDLTLVLGAPGGETPPEVLCWGVIVRREPRPDDPALLAARIVHYDFVRPEERQAFAAAISLAKDDRKVN